MKMFHYFQNYSIILNQQAKIPEFQVAKLTAVLLEHTDILPFPNNDHALINGIQVEINPIPLAEY